MLLEKLKNKTRIVITGVPRSGKTILSKRLSKILKIPVLHTDDQLHVPWEHLPDAIKQSAEACPEYIVEGCQASRALKHGLEADIVILMTRPYVPLTKKQAIFAAQMLQYMEQYTGEVLCIDEE